ncbi:MAG: MBL fold metallo-hydrolase [bacterium]|nr:MBL fold metallo-hydrolase [bacterium]MCP5070374.1 MBL fold metallo-hydrolase [bacterium]
MSIASILIATILVGAALLAIGMLALVVRFHLGRWRAERHWAEARVEPLADLGTTTRLEVLPLSDWHVGDGDFDGEAGVAYLVRTDSATVLFDLGLNERQADPSPLLRNMQTLGVTQDELDAVVISHMHPDHVGGMPWSRRRTFSLTGGRQPSLGTTAAYVPEPMTYPGLQPRTVEGPVRIAEGLASIGAISAQLFFFGWTREQALAVHVEGKGIVLIVGCGHQTVSKVVARARTLFDAPIHGIIGGLHYPVTDGRFRALGIPVQRFVGTGKPPWRPVTVGEVEQDIDLLRSCEPKVVALSPHDSCDASIAQFRDAFPTAYRDVRVGESILI